MASLNDALDSYSHVPQPILYHNLYRNTDLKTTNNNVATLSKKKNVGEVHVCTYIVSTCVIILNPV